MESSPKKNLGYDDTPIIPGTRFKVHDGTRPQPRIVRPGQTRLARIGIDTYSAHRVAAGLGEVPPGPRRLKETPALNPPLPIAQPHIGHHIGERHGIARAGDEGLGVGRGAVLERGGGDGLIRKAIGDGCNRNP